MESNQCIDGGLCATPLTIGGNSSDAYLLTLSQAALDCWRQYLGSNQVEACSLIDVQEPLIDLSGAAISSTGNALDVEGEICDPQGEIAQRYTRNEYEILKDLFGCGVFNVWNVWWNLRFSAGEQFCLYYTPRKNGYTYPPFDRTEILVFDRCDRSWEDD